MSQLRKITQSRQPQLLATSWEEGNVMPHNIESLFTRLDRLTGPLPLQTILDWITEVPLKVEDVANYLIFRPERYVRNRLHDGPGYQALVLCWRNGQRSPIHNHRGSSCGVKVLRGVATETLFDRAPNGMVVPVSSRDLPPGHICASADEDIHQVSNLQAGDADLVTLHVYSPPLLRMDMFSLDSPVVREWDDPVNDPFILGGGI
jgi:cysteine dioxygenase